MLPPYSPKCLEEEEFYELRLYGVLGSSQPLAPPKQQQKYATWYTKIRHLGDAHSTRCLLPW